MKRLLFLFIVLSQLPLFSGSLIQKPVRKFKLKSGATLIFQENKRSDLVNLSMAVRLPSVEGKHSAGVGFLLGAYLRKHDKKLLHFLLGSGVPIMEHSYSVYNDYLKFWLSFLKKDQDEVLNVTCNNYFHPKWDQKVFEKIKKKIVKHINTLTKEKLSFGRLHSFTLDKTNSGTLLAKTAYPDAKDIASVSLDDLKKLHKRIFTPLGLSFAVIGNISLKDFLNKVEPSLSQLDNQKPVKKLRHRSNKKYEKVHYDNVRESMAMISFLGPKTSSKDYLKFTKIRKLLSMGFDNIFNKLEQETDGIYDLDMSTSLSETGSMIHITYKDENNRPEIFAKKVFEAIMLFRESKISDKELSLFKRLINNDYIELQSNPDKFVQKAITLGIYESLFSSSTQYQRLISSMSSEDLRDICAKYLSLDTYQYHSIEPIANQVKSQISHKKVEIGGLKVLLESDPNQQMSGFSWAYIFSDDAKNPVLAQIAMMTLSEAKDRIKNKVLQSKIKNLGLKISSTIQVSHLMNSLQFPINDLDNVVKLLPNLIFDYKITENDYQNAVRKYNRNYEWFANYKSDYAPFYRELFPKKYLMFPYLLDKKHLKNTNFRKVKKYLKGSIAESRVKLVCVGDFDSKIMSHKLKKSFRRFFKKNPKYKLDLSILPSYINKKIESLKINKKMKDKRYHVFRGSIFEKGELDMDELAGLFISVLNFLIHEKHFRQDGFEDISMNLSFNDLGGMMALIIHFEGPLKKSEALKNRIDKQIAKITYHVNEKVLKKLKTLFMYSKNQEKLNLKKRAGALSTMFRFGYSLNFEDELLKSAEKLTPKDVEKIFKSKFDGGLIMEINGK
ncbi:MAG: hypothetical protein COB02_05005 [Candidatus Cloacimonadota bacterium]|nr:MAG: hypothetical protein COB02_05005 [Candidatus Cloacimonadota bacterium]